jgi:hypothetical protein
MRCCARSALAGAAAVVLLLAGCTGGEPDPVQQPSTSSASAVGVPSTAELAAALIAPDDLEGSWMLYEGGDSQDGSPGVIPEDEGLIPEDEQQEGGSAVVLCERASAESLAAAEALRFKAGRQLGPSGQEPWAGDVLGPVIGEYLTSGEPADVEVTFNALRDGMQACVGDVSGTLDNGTEFAWTVAELALPEAGDDRYGNVAVGTTAVDYHDLFEQAVVRSGPVLMYAQVAGGTRGDVVAPYTGDQLADLMDAVVTIATEKLP